MNMNHYDNVRDAVSDSALGQEPLVIEELARAIADGLRQYGNHTENLLALTRFLAEYSGEPVDVHNRAEEHTSHGEQR